MLGIGIALDSMLLNPDAFGRAVAALGALRRRAVNFVQDRVVNISAKRAFDRLKIWAMAVCRDLNAVDEARREIINEGDCCLARSIPDPPFRPSSAAASFLGGPSGTKSSTSPTLISTINLPS
jgi:hypothetical protein